MDIASANVSIWIDDLYSFHRKALKISASSHFNLDVIKGIIWIVS